jgi:hypothetical protein
MVRLEHELNSSALSTNSKEITLFMTTSFLPNHD